jgi:hypothetical protein
LASAPRCGSSVDGLKPDKTNSCFSAKCICGVGVGAGVAVTSGVGVGVTVGVVVGVGVAAPTVSYVTTSSVGVAALLLSLRGALKPQPRVITIPTSVTSASGRVCLSINQALI